MSKTAPAATPIGINIFLIALVSFAILLRFISRKLSGAGFWWDDWLVLAAWPFSVAISSTFLAAAYHGFGHHGGDPTFFLHVLYFDELFYITGITLSKLSVLAFYRRVFARTRALKNSSWALGALTVTWWLAFLIAGAIQCTPTAGFWNPKIKAKCSKIFPSFLATAISNIMLDFALLILPLHSLWQLKMKTVQKLSLVLVFILGYLNPIISILRIVALIQLGNKTKEDINYKFTSLALWSTAEVAVGIFSCSIPSWGILFQSLTSSKESKSDERNNRHSERSKKVSTKGKKGFGRDSSSLRQLHGLDSTDTYSGFSYKHINLATGGRRETPDSSVELHDADRIVVKNEFDVERGSRHKTLGAIN